MPNKSTTAMRQDYILRWCQTRRWPWRVTLIARLDLNRLRTGWQFCCAVISQAHINWSFWWLGSLANLDASITSIWMCCLLCTDIAKMHGWPHLFSRTGFMKSLCLRSGGICAIKKWNQRPFCLWTTVQPILEWNPLHRWIIKLKLFFYGRIRRRKFSHWTWVLLQPSNAITGEIWLTPWCIRKQVSQISSGN